MLFREIISANFGNYTKPIETPCGQSAESLNVKPGVNI
jgi:hypothetical protein